MLENTPAATITVSTLSSHTQVSGVEAAQAALLVLCVVALLASSWALIQRYKRRSLRKSNGILAATALVSVLGIAGALTLPLLLHVDPNNNLEDTVSAPEVIFTRDDCSLSLDSARQFTFDSQESFDEIVELPITAHGIYDGTITVSVKSGQISAPDGSSLNIESTGDSLVFSSSDFSENTTKNICIRVTGGSLFGNQWTGPVDFSFTTRDLFPKGTHGWYSPDNNATFYYIEDDHTARGWIERTEAPDGPTDEPQRFWLDENTGVLARNKAVATSASTYAYAKDNGAVVQGLFNDGKGNVFLADNEGNLVWNNKTGRIESDYGEGSQVYYVDKESHGAKSGFFFAEGKKRFGTDKGYVLHGTASVNDHLVFTDDNGELVEHVGWVTADQGEKTYFDTAYTDDENVEYRGAHTGFFEVDGARYYGDMNTGYIATDTVIHIEGHTYSADINGQLTELKEWSVDKADWAHAESDTVGVAEDQEYLESCRARAEATGSSTDYYVTVDNRWEGGGRVIVFHRENGYWVALAGWYANVGRWTGSGDDRGTRSIPGVHTVTHKIAEGTVDNGNLSPWTIPWFVCYVDSWPSEPHTNTNDDGQGFHYTPNPNEQGNDMSGCAAFTTEWRAKWIYDNVPLGTSVDVYGAAHGIKFD